MYSAGYPEGAANDPRAPWNENETAMVTCQECDGTGYHYFAYDFARNEETECSQEEWLRLPETCEEAEALGTTTIQGEREECFWCGGKGEVERYVEYYDEWD